MSLVARSGPMLARSPSWYFPGTVKSHLERNGWLRPNLSTAVLIPSSPEKY